MSNGSALFSPLVMRDVALANRIAVRRTALRLLRIAAVSLAVAAPIASAQNDAYPSKPVRIVIGAAPGGGLDATARAIQDRLVAARSGSRSSCASTSTWPPYSTRRK